MYKHPNVSCYAPILMAEITWMYISDERIDGTFGEVSRTKKPLY
jgi:hypothetical protein